MTTAATTATERHPLDASRSDRFWPSARVIADSLSPNGVRLVTVEATFHRFILAEANTHRVFSRNSASSRAIPVAKTLARVRERCALPVEWGRNQSGMSAREILDPDTAAAVEARWLEARDYICSVVEDLVEMGLHKQVANRLLEPFMDHTVIITATDWDGFFDQRCHRDAQPEMQAAAHQIRQAIAASDPVGLGYGEWHLPYVRPDDWDDPTIAALPGGQIEGLKKVSVGRCARVSYLTHDGVRDPMKDWELCTGTLEGQTPPHASPFEHVATPAGRGETIRGNFRGWHQYRHLLLDY